MIELAHFLAGLGVSTASDSCGSTETWQIQIIMHVVDNNRVQMRCQTIQKYPRIFMSSIRLESNGTGTSEGSLTWNDPSLNPRSLSMLRLEGNSV